MVRNSIKRVLEQGWQHSGLEEATYPWDDDVTTFSHPNFPGVQLRENDGWRHRWVAVFDPYLSTE